MATKHEQPGTPASKPAQTGKPKRAGRRTSLQASVPRVLFERGPRGAIWFGIITESNGDRGAQGSKTSAGKALRLATRTGEFRSEDFPAPAIEEDESIASSSIAELDALLVRLDEGIAAERSAMASLLERLAGCGKRSWPGGAGKIES